ncbi:MAG: protein kinase [Planctomycetes bacterium]|nr:protein kinase [Planctomycetota bacterium]
MSRLVEESAFEPENAGQREALAFLRLEGTSHEAAPFPGAGDQVADFVIEQELGRGGAGVVYRARQLGLGRSVALKLIPHGPAALTDAYAHRLEREGRMLASVKHESIPTVHAAGVVPGFHYVAVDLIDGTTLKDVIHGRASGFPRPGDPRWLPFLLGILHRIAGALGAAHASGIVHRDVKPGNVLVDHEGRPFLVDFGLAREQGVTGNTLTRGFVGTPLYASPEQVRGDPVGVASDVFSFGALAFEAVTGRSPFESESVHALADEIRFADPQWPIAVRVPRDFRAVIEKCMEKRVSERYADAREVEAELARLLRFEHVLAAPRGRFARAWRRVKRRPLPWLVGAGLVLTLGSVGTTTVLARAALYEERQAALTEAVRILSKGGIEEARAKFAAFVADPNGPEGAAGRLADLHLYEGEAGKAASLYRIELEQGSTKIADWAGHQAAAGVLAHRPWNVDLGKREPVSSRDFMVLALSHELNGDVPAAVEAIKQAIKLNPLPLIPRKLLQKYLLKLGKISRISDELAFAARLMPKLSIELTCLLAQVLHRQHRYEEEQQCLEQALEGAPEEPLLLAELALCKLRLHQSEAALELAQRAYALAPEEGRVIDALASNLVSERRYAEARLLLRDAALALPGDPHLLSSSAHLALQTGALDEAARLTEELVSIGARDERWLVQGLELRGRVQAARGAYPEALATFRGLEAREPEIMDWPLLIGTILEKTGDLAEAETAVDRTLALGPIEPEVLYAKASLLRATGRPREALHALQRGLWRRAEAGTTNYWMAVTWLELDQPGEALLCAREAVKAHDDWREARELQARCEAVIRGSAQAIAADREPLECPNEPSVK